MSADAHIDVSAVEDGRRRRLRADIATVRIIGCTVGAPPYAIRSIPVMCRPAARAASCALARASAIALAVAMRARVRWIGECRKRDALDVCHTGFGERIDDGARLADRRAPSRQTRG